MTSGHLCISARSNQLLRWQQAFPNGKIVSSAEDARPFLSGTNLLWIHADSFAGNAVLGVLDELCRNYNGLPFVVISCMPNPSEATSVLKAGASGYCHAMAVPTMLQQVALVVQNGGIWVGPDLMKTLIDVITPALASQSPDGLRAVMKKLSSREQEVALQVARGASNKEIARTLAITERTVKAHLGSIFEKLDIRDRLQLALLLSLDDSGSLQKASL